MLLQAPVQLAFTGDGGNAVLDFARQELESYLGRIFTGNAGGSRLGVHFALGGENGLRFDGYMLRPEGQLLTITSAQPRGILYGVYEFLRLLGCRFLFPLPQPETVPSHSSFTLAEQAVLKNPWMEFRGLALYEATAKTIPQTVAMIDWMTKNNYNLLLTSVHRECDSGTDANAMLWDETAHALLPELQKRGTVIDMSEHSTDCFFPRDTLFEQHPEWFALLDGRRVRGKICLSNPDAVRAYADSFVDFVKTHHDFDIIGLWPLDGGGYCQCEQCADKYAGLRANMEVARRIGEVRPDLIVEHLAYTPQNWTPPEEDLPSNMSVLVCDKHDDIGYGWGVRARNAGGAFFFDYLTGDNYRFRANVWLNPYYCHEMVNTFVSYHYRGVISLFLPISNWWQSCLNYGYLAQLYYDPTLAVDTWAAQIAGDLFGPAHAKAGADILHRVVTQLQDRPMWSRVPHTSPQYKARLYDHALAVDNAHSRYIHDMCEELAAALDGLLAEDLPPAARLQAECLKEYVQLQWLFFNGVDQYDPNAHDNGKIDAYLDALARLEQKPGRGFISQAFARFRIYETGDVLYDA